ncbi:hypothetical protein JCM16106_16050 [Hydrogenophilus islandicus]
MEAIGGGVEATVEGDRFARKELTQRFRVGALGNQSAGSQVIQEVVRHGSSVSKGIRGDYNVASAARPSRGWA